MLPAPAERRLFEIMQLILDVFHDRSRRPRAHLEPRQSPVQLGYVGNDADETVRSAETFDGISDGVKGLWIECPETFIDEKAVEPDRSRCLLNLFA